ARKSVRLLVGKAMFYYDVASFNVAEVPEPSNQGFEIGPLFLGTASVPKHPDYRNSSRLLRARRERPSRRAADERDERAALHSITSSARASKVDGISSPIALAVLRLKMSLNFVGICTGRSPGFSPRRMRSTYSAVLRRASSKS